MTIISCHVEGNGTDELRKHLMVEIRSASDLNKIESVFPLPISNFFQVKGLSKGRHLLKLQSGLPSSSLKFESDIIEVDLEKNVQIHVGPLRYWIEDQLKQVSSFVSTLSSFVCLFFFKVRHELFSVFFCCCGSCIFYSYLLYNAGVDSGTSIPSYSCISSCCTFS